MVSRFGSVRSTRLKGLKRSAHFRELVYFDYAASTPLRREVLDVTTRSLREDYGNPSSIHTLGEQSRKVVEEARSRIGSVLNVSEGDKVIFTSCGSESISLALKGVVFHSLFAHADKNAHAGNKGSLLEGKLSLNLKKFNFKPHVITSAIEHKAVLATLYDLYEKGVIDLTVVGVSSLGLVSVPALLRCVRPTTILVSLHYVNNEIGCVQQISKLGLRLRRRGVLFYVDACQAPCYFSCDVRTLNCDLLTLTSSKVGGPKGVGLLYVRSGVMLDAQICGGSQEFGFRAGTENVAGVVGFSVALDTAFRLSVKEAVRVRSLQKKLWYGLSVVGGIKCNSDLIGGSPQVLSVSLKDVEGEAVVRYLSDKGICVSTGSACTSREVDVSHVISALGVVPSYALGTVRFSLGWGSTEAEVRKVVAEFLLIVRTLRLVC